MGNEGKPSSPSLQVTSQSTAEGFPPVSALQQNCACDGHLEGNADKTSLCLPRGGKEQEH